MKIAFLIPITSRGREWNNLNDCYLINHTLKSFIQTKNDGHKYSFYIGFDLDDSFFINNIDKLKNIFNKLNIELDITFFENIKKGHLTRMWNVLFQKAYNNGNDYFYQSGDDIDFRTQNWINDSINALMNNNNIGVSGPNNVGVNNTTLTQAMVSRKHMEIFGYFFPSSIINWYCDNWISEVYYPKHSFKLNQHYAPNLGGKERYDIAVDKSDYHRELFEGTYTLNKYLSDIKNIVSGEEFYKLCKWSFCPRYEKQFNFNPSQVLENDYVFLNLDHFNNFLNILNGYPTVKKFNLITHNSDFPFDQIKYDNIEKYVNKIYAINASAKGIKLVKIPLGLVDNKYKNHDVLLNISYYPDIKNILVYLNFSIHTNINERQRCYDILKQKSFITSEFNLPPIEFYKKIKLSKYIISPDGTGFDCHRIYESILFNSIPIIKRNPLSDFYEKLPVILIDKWEEISEENLINNYNKYYNRLLEWKEKNKDWYKATWWINHE